MFFILLKVFERRAQTEKSKALLIKSQFSNVYTESGIQEVMRVANETEYAKEQKMMGTRRVFMQSKHQTERRGRRGRRNHHRGVVGEDGEQDDPTSSGERASTDFAEPTPELIRHLSNFAVLKSPL